MNENEITITAGDLVVIIERGEPCSITVNKNGEAVRYEPTEDRSGAFDDLFDFIAHIPDILQEMMREEL